MMMKEEIIKEGKKLIYEIKSLLGVTQLSAAPETRLDEPSQCTMTLFFLLL